jgi:tetratricopeptide (TPR) repeat protein
VAAVDDEKPLDEALVAAKPDDAPGLALARSRIAAKLFGNDAPGFGRFRVLERLGGGGMGVVYAAYDPQLDRGVALKTVHVPSQSQEVALREAKALAKLSHPNVVAVFDVGVEQGHVYIVMELVRGDTLRTWIKDRPVGDIVDAYRQAAQGLAAAHDSGLVHRDFKPDNAIVGKDGRVRVVDFGLAVESDASAGRAGTPRYMAPEPTLTPATDQFSFGTSLGEAIPEPRPAWIEAIVTRACAQDPAARFPSMHEIVRALGRDPVRIRRRRIMVAVGALALASLAFVVGRQAAPAEEPCQVNEQAWPAQAQAVQLARIAALSPYGRELAAQLTKRLDEHRASWISNAHAACVAHRRGEQSDALFDRRMACLDRGRAALTAVGDLATSSTATTLPDLAQAAASLPVPDACSDVASLVDDVEPPAPALAPQVAALRRDLEGARVQIAAGHFVDARATADNVTAAARALRYQPLTAEAALVAGHATMAMFDRAGATARLDAALADALASGRTDVGIEAWARRAYVVGTADHPEHALDGNTIVESLAERSHSPFVRALLANNIGNVYLGRADRAAAKAAFERALAWAKQVQGPGAVELVNVRTNLALVVDTPAESDRLFVDAHDELARLLGADHPETLIVEWTRAMKTMSSPDQAAAYLATLCERMAQHPSLAATAAACFVELSEVHEAIGDRDGARSAIERAYAVPNATFDDTPEAPGYRALHRDDVPAAVSAFEAALREVPRGNVWFYIYTRGKLELGLARASHDANAASRAIDAFSSIAAEQQAAAIDRKLAAARALRDAFQTSRAPATPKPAN